MHDICFCYTENTDFKCKQCHIKAVEVKEILKKFKGLPKEKDKVNEIHKLRGKYSHLKDANKLNEKMIKDKENANKRLE